MPNSSSMMLGVAGLATVAAHMYLAKARLDIEKRDAYRLHVLREAFEELPHASGFAKDLGAGASWSTFVKAAKSAGLFSCSIFSFEADVQPQLGDRYANALRFNLPPTVIHALALEVVRACTDVEDAIAAVPVGEHTWANTMQPMCDAERRTSAMVTNTDFMGSVSPDKEVRDACRAAEHLLSDFYVESSMRVDVYEAVLAFSRTDEAAALEGERERYLARTLEDFQRRGLHLDQASRAKIEGLQKRLSSLAINFAKNMGEEKTKFAFSSAQLAGLSEAQLQAFTALEGGDSYEVTLSYPDYFAVMKHCSVVETRKTMEKAFNSRCLKENTPLIEEMVTLRAQQAALLDFDSHSHYVLARRMAKTPDTVMTFLRGLSTSLEPLMNKDIEYLLSLKQKECTANGTPFDGKLHMWDMNYYKRMCEEKRYEVDHEEIKKYFPLAKVTEELLLMYQELLGLTFTEIPGASVWEDSVRMFEVHDTDSKDFMGHFYLDLFPREGKYKHAAVFGLVGGCDNPDTQGRQYPVAAMVANFAKPTADRPSLLPHSQVVTYFHEFGHVMHNICARAELRRFAGTAVERDFVEAPSQMLENWCWEAESLARLSGHFETGEKLPAELTARLVASKNANAGLNNKRQLVFGLLDQEMHSKDQADTASIYASVVKEVMGLDVTPGTNMVASFGHLAGGYDASYYGYMWSEVYSMDMFASRFQKEGIMNPKTGKDYRDCILKPGGSMDGMDMLRAFLGREPNQDAFLKSKGL